MRDRYQTGQEITADYLAHLQTLPVYNQFRLMNDMKFINCAYSRSLSKIQLNIGKHNF